MESPEIIVTALFENGQESYNAVPIVRDIMKAYFDKKAREGKFPSQSAFAPRLLLNAPKTPLALLTLPAQEGVVR
jgi:hypothetical protein